MVARWPTRGTGGRPRPRPVGLLRRAAVQESVWLIRPSMGLLGPGSRPVARPGVAARRRRGQAVRRQRGSGLGPDWPRRRPVRAPAPPGGHQHAGQAPGRQDPHAADHDLAAGDLGAVNRHDRQNHHPWIGQHLGGLVGLERHRSQWGGKGMAAMPQPPACVELEAAPVLFGVDHEHPTGADHKVISIGCRAWDGQVVQDGPPVSLQRSKQPGGAPLPRRSRRQATASELG